MITFRSTNIDDIGKILVLFDKVFGRKITYEYFLGKYSWNNELTTYVACKDEKIIGHVGFSLRQYSRCSELCLGASRHSSFVLDKHRKSGVYRLLNEYARGELVKLGVDFIQAWPNKNNIISTMKHKGLFGSTYIPMLTRQINGALFTREEAIKQLTLGSEVVDNVDDAPLINAIESSLALTGSFFTVMKDFEYLRSRYFSEALGKYIVFRYGFSDASYIVTSFGEHDNRMTLKLMDFFGDQSKHNAHIKHIIAKLEGVQILLQSWCGATDKQLLYDLYSAGFTTDAPVFLTCFYNLGELPQVLTGDDLFNYRPAMGDTDV